MTRSRKAIEGGEAPLRVKLVEAITAPLGFYVLALLIAETFLGAVLVSTKLDATNTMNGVWIGVAMFGFVVGVVSLFVWFRPSNLTFDKNAHLLDRGKVPYGSDQDRVDPKTLFTGDKKEESR